MNNLIQNIKESRSAIVSIGVMLNEKRVKVFGTGFIYKNKIVTALHLIDGLKEKELKSLICSRLTFDSDYNQKYTWEGVEIFKKGDESNGICLLEFKNTIEDLKNVELGNSNDLEVGQEVYCLGFPYYTDFINNGFGITLIANKAIVSNIKYSKNEESGVKKLRWIFIGIAMNPGNAGSPLFDVVTNKVVGMQSITLEKKSEVYPKLDIKKSWHISGFESIDSVDKLLTS